MSRNGFRRVAECWAVFFRQDAQDAKDTKLALKQTYSIDRFSASGESNVKIGECLLEGDRTSGKVQSKGHTIEWDFKMAPRQNASFNMVPPPLAKIGLVKNKAVTVNEDLTFTGTAKIDGEEFEWNQAPGMQGHLRGPKNGQSWVWGHCNSFVDENGKDAPFIFDGLTARARIAGGIVTPRLSSFYFFYKGKHYRLNSLRNAVHRRSKSTLTDWQFRADQGEISFRGHMKADHKDFAGLTYEDTNGSLLYCANSKLSDLQVHVYRHGKLESSFYGNKTAAFEIVSRQKNPYVQLLI